MEKGIMFSIKSLFDQSERKKIEGMEASFRHADSEWVKAANARIKKLVDLKTPFTSDDVVEYLDTKGVVTGNNSALGAIMQSWQRSGQIQPTGIYLPSRRVKRHKAPVRQWVGL